MTTADTILTCACVSQFMFLLVVYNCIYIPIDIAFSSAIDKTLGHCIFDLIVDLLFIFDMLLNLRTTYYDDDNNLVLEPRKILKRYLTSWFAIDFLAVFPFDLSISGWTCGTESESNDSSKTTVIKLFKALRLLRMLRFRKELERLSGANALRAVVSLFSFILVAHWLACVWWAVGVFGYYEDKFAAGDGPVSCDHSRPCSWIRRLPAGSMQMSPESPSIGFAQQYLTSFYWSLTTLMKTPWITPDTMFEKIIGLTAIGLGAIFYASFLSTVQGSYNNYIKGAAQKRDKLATLSAATKAWNIPAPLRAKLLKHMNTQLESNPSGLVSTAVMQQLPSHLRGEVALAVYNDATGQRSTLFYRQCSLECTKQLMIRFQAQLCMPDQVLIGKGEVCKNRYFLTKGILRVSAEPPSQPNNGQTSSTADTDSGSPARRKSSMAKAIGNMRELEKPGESIGFIEPRNAQYLGIFPVWVTASKGLR